MPLRLIAGRAVVTQAEIAAIQSGHTKEQDVIDKLLAGATVESGPLKVALRAKKHGGRRIYELEVG